MSVETVFVAIASYRDPECICTIKDLIAKAKYPERINVGVCLQLSSQDQELVISPRQGLRIIQFDVAESKGACWAKKQAMDLWHDEEYVLMIDSHMRFAQNWDQRMIDMLNQCPADKALLSTYPAPYDPPEELKFSRPHLVAKCFDENSKILKFRGLRLPEAVDKPKRGAFIAGGFIFSRSELFQQVPYDEQIYFHGEEVLFSVRAWTWGWNVFAPHECLIHHYYGRNDSSKHWNDYKDWPKLEQASVKKVLHLLKTEIDPNLKVDETCVFGNSRTLKDFEVFAGVDFKVLEISEKAMKGMFDEECK